MKSDARTWFGWATDKGLIDSRLENALTTDTEWNTKVAIGCLRVTTVRKNRYVIRKSLQES